MRVLIILRGLPGAGKSTWVEENGLSEYAVSPDKIRLMYGSPELDKDGVPRISQKNDKAVWRTVYDIVENRLSNGELTIVDATSTSDKAIARFADIAKKYRCRLYCVDFSDVSVEECKRRNRMRDPLKYVPEEVIDRMYIQMNRQKVPKCKVIKPTEIEKIMYSPIDLSKYKKINHIGDIHGCASVLKEAIPQIKHDEFYIFTGDYIDRGIENSSVIKMLLNIMDCDNVVLLEGNHERHLRAWAKNEDIKSEVFNKETRYQLENDCIDKKRVRQLCSRLAQCMYYTYKGKEVFCCHGGISSSLHKSFPLISSSQMINGIGSYGECKDVMHVWEKENDIYQIHGHRNINNHPIHYTDRCFNLEGSVEMGGHLRVVSLSDEGFECREYENNIYSKRNWMRSIDINDNNIANIIKSLRSSELIRERKYGDVSAFNFTRDAFDKAIWNDMTVRARGLYIDTKDKKVVARGYDKFFEIGEREDNTLEKIKIDDEFDVYVKENGYLALMSYNRKLDEMMYMTKQMSSLDNEDSMSEHVIWAKEIINKSVKNMKALDKYLKDNDVTVIFEIIDPIRDTHVIKYDEQKAIMLDIVDNSINFNSKKFHHVEELSKACKCEHKMWVMRMRNGKQSIENMIRDMSDSMGIEGYVIKDGSGHMYKLKTPYYKRWKKLRTVKNSVYAKGEYVGNQSLQRGIEREFYEWLLEHEDVADKSIIELRDMFNKYKESEE